MTIAVLMLSGGASKRMGQDKASLSVGRQSLLNWQIERFETAGFEVISDLPDVYAGFLGPLAGIHSALRNRPEVSSWLVVPVDMPLLSVSTLNQLLEHGSRLGLPVSFEDCPLPLFLPSSTRLLSLLESWLSQPDGKRSVFAFLNAVDGKWLQRTDFEKELININTPEQWQQYKNGVELV